VDKIAALPGNQPKSHFTGRYTGVRGLSHPNVAEAVKDNSDEESEADVADESEGALQTNDHEDDSRGEDVATSEGATDTVTVGSIFYQGGHC